MRAQPIILSNLASGQAVWERSGKSLTEPNPTFRTSPEANTDSTWSAGSQCIRAWPRPCRRPQFIAAALATEAYRGLKPRTIFPASVARPKPCPDTVRHGFGTLDIPIRNDPSLSAWLVATGFGRPSSRAAMCVCPCAASACRSLLSLPRRWYSKCSDSPRAIRLQPAIDDRTSATRYSSHAFSMEDMT